MRKFLCLFLSLVLCVSVQKCYVKAEENGGEVLKSYYEKMQTSEKIVLAKDSKESKAVQKYHKIRKILNKTNKEMECYGGCYIDDNNDIVVMTDNKKEIKEEGISADYFVKCDYSYDELQNTYNELNKMLDEYSVLCQNGKLTNKERNIFNNICGFFVSIKDNSVIVSLLDINDEKSIETIKKYVTNPDILKFEKSERVEENATTLKLGRYVYVYPGTGGYVNSGSIGIKAYYINSKGDKVHGFITAGHVSKKVGNYVYASANVSQKEIGKVVKRKWSGTVDASFVKITNSDYSVSRTVYYSNAKGSKSDGVTIKKNLYTYLYEGAIGETVYKAGGTTYLTKGKLISDSATEKYGGVVIKNMYKSSYKSSKGDSGGVVYYHDKDGYQYLGINVACGDYSYAVKWQNIDKVWGIYFE